MPAWTIKIEENRPAEHPGLQETLYTTTIQLVWTESEKEQWVIAQYLNSEMSFENGDALEAWTRAFFLGTLEASRGNPGQIAVLVDPEGATRVEDRSQTE